MNRTPIEWVKNPDGTQGYTWNPITGCLNGCEYCYARKLAHTRLRERYLANINVVPINLSTHPSKWAEAVNRKALTDTLDPFYPRAWFDRREPTLESNKPKGIFVCDMSDLFGTGIPEEWTRHVLTLIMLSPQHRFYLLTKQPQNLIKFSPFPENCWVGVSATDTRMFIPAINWLDEIEAKIKYISFEPLIGHIPINSEALKISGISWVIIGAQTSPKKMPKWEWVKGIIDACDKSGVAVFLKNNLGLPRLNGEGATPFYKRIASGTMELRQELPR